MVLVEGQLAQRSQQLNKENAANQLPPPSMVTKDDDSEVEIFLKHALTDGDFITLSYDLKLLANDDTILEDQ